MANRIRQQKQKDDEESVQIRQIDIFLAFFRVGILGYGGGPSSIPLVHREVVSRYKWMDSDQFSDILALGNALPGPIATKIAGYIGFRIAGVLGMLNALVATVLPSTAMIILLLTVLNAYKDKPWVSGMSHAVVPVVAVMLTTLTWSFLKNSFSSNLGWVWTAVFSVGTLILLQWLNVHPAVIIFVLILGALLKRDSTEKRSDEEDSTITVKKESRL